MAFFFIFNFFKIRRRRRGEGRTKWLRRETFVYNKRGGGGGEASRTGAVRQTKKILTK
jgi:hypothetical protein